MSKREDLALLLYSMLGMHSPEISEKDRTIFRAYWDTDAYFKELWGHRADAILDELMEPDPEAIEQTANDLLLLKSDVYDCWQAILTRTKAGKP